MIRRLVGCLLLFAVVVSALPWELAAAPFADSQPVLVEAPGPHQCPVPVPAGDPCGDGCLCPCCPAHSLTPPATDLAVKAPLPDARGALPGYSRALHQSDFLDRVFHPPRLG